MNILSTFTLTRRRFLQVTGVAGAVAGGGLTASALRTIAPGGSSRPAGHRERNHDHHQERLPPVPGALRH